ncbi:MAG: hypothetical protein GY867_01000 [bacterium]|nr:hypothetical protein [bacterium]
MSRRRQSNRAKVKSGNLSDSPWLKFGSKIGLSLVVVILFLSLVQCTIKKPEAPTWTTQFTVPLVNRTYEMAEIVDKIDQEGIGIDADSNVVYSLTRDIDTVALDGDELTTSNLSYAVTEQLGEVSIDPPVLSPATMDLSAISGLAAFVPGTVPAMGFNVNSNLPTISTFTALTITSGRAYAVVSNHLGFDLTTVDIELFDVIHNQVVGTQSIAGGLADGATDSAMFALSGRSISNDLVARIDAYTPGAAVLSASGKYLSTVLRFDGALTVAAATAEIPGLSRSFSENVTLGESDPVYRATLSNGTLALTINNGTNLGAVLDITFPDLNDGSSPFAVQQTVTANSSQVVNIDLAGYELAPSDSTAPQDIVIDVVATVPGTAPQHVAVSQIDEFSVTAGLSNLEFGSVTGRFSAVESTIDPRDESIDVPDGFDQITLASAIVTLEIENGVELPGTLDLTLQGDNGKTLNISGNVAAASAGGPVVSTIIDSAIADFLSPVPSLITISGSGTFGDGVTVGTITADDYIYAQVHILAPLEVIIDSASIEADVQAEEIDQSGIDAITDHVVEARFLYNIVNHLPIGTSVNIHLGGDSAAVYDSPQLSFEDIFVTAAPVTAGVANDTVSTGYQVILLDSADIQILKNDTLYIGSEIVLDNTGGQPVRLTNNDYIQVIGRIEVEYRFDGDF